MTATEAARLLEQFRAGKIDRDTILRVMLAAPIVDLGFAQVDTHRALRKGFPEVIFGEGKTPAQVAANDRVLITRIGPEHVRVLKKKFRHAVHHEMARCVSIQKKPLPKRPGAIAVVCAGTSDLPVAEEAAVTAEIMGNSVVSINDVGVAGLHRLLSRVEALRSVNVIIAVAGMEGALPSVIAGLVSHVVLNGDGVLLKNKQPAPGFPPAGPYDHLDQGAHERLGNFTYEPLPALAVSLGVKAQPRTVKAATTGGDWPRKVDFALPLGHSEIVLAEPQARLGSRNALTLSRNLIYELNS